MNKGIALVAVFLIAALSAPAQTALEPDQGGVDFKIQGEFMGGLDSAATSGAQVVALGSGKFRAIFLTGGLPGLGWNGKDRTEVLGNLQGTQALFNGSGYSATVTADGQSLTGTMPDGAHFSLAKTLRPSPTLNLQPAAGAVVLFNGNGVTAFESGTATMDSRNFLAPDGSGALTKQSFQTFQLHVEFREPFMPSASGQQRGNSGIYLQKRAELQVLDSFGFDLKADTTGAKEQCGAFWQSVAPDLNMCYPPLSWQTYDVDFTAARFDSAGTKMLEPVHVTVRQNGVVIHADRKLTSGTLLGDLMGPAPGPFLFQFHNDPVYYRNIWVTQAATSIEGAKPRGPLEKRRSLLKFPNISTQNFTAMRLDGRAIAAKIYSLDPYGKSRSATGTYAVTANNDGNRIYFGEMWR